MNSGDKVEAQSLQCPHCGAPLTVKAGETLVTCEYCGSQIMLANNAPPTIQVAGAAYMAEVLSLVMQGQRDQAISLFLQASGATPERAATVIDLIAQSTAQRVAAPSVPAVSVPTATRKRPRLGCLGILVIACVCVGLFLGFGNLAIRTSESFTTAMKLINANPKVTQALGQPISAGLLIAGTFSSSRNSSFDYNFPVSGPRGAGHARVFGSLGQTDMQLTVDVTYKQGNQEVTTRLTQQGQ